MIFQNGRSRSTHHEDSETYQMPMRIDILVICKSMASVSKIVYTIKRSETFCQLKYK